MKFDQIFVILGQISLCLAHIANISKSCNETLTSLKNPEVILRSLDAWGKPVGILEGTFTSLGDYDECMKIPVMNGIEFTYALVEGTLGISAGSNNFSLSSELGVCVPKDCLNDIGRLVNVARSYLAPDDKSPMFVKYLYAAVHSVFMIVDAKDIPITYVINSVHPTKKSPWTGGDIAYVIILGLILTLVLVSTVIQYARESPAFRKKKYETQEEGDEEQVPLVVTESKNPQDVVEIVRKKPSMVYRIMNCFSLYQTLPLLTRGNSKASPELNALNTIRSISMWWVVLGHVMGVFLERAPVDVLAVLDRAKEFSFVVILNAFLSVDSFFFLSAFLLAYIIFKTDSLRKFNYIQYVVFRYLRLTFSYALVMFGWFLFYPHLGNGPLWYIKQDENPAKCSKYWWSHLLYLNELVPELMDDSCMSWSWYLAADFHLYMVAPIFLYSLYKLKGKKKYLVFVLAFLICAAITISTSMVNHLPAIATPVKGNVAFADSRKEHSKWMRNFYQKPWNHLTVYLIGLLCGYLSFKHRNLKLSMIRVTLFQLLGIAMMLSALYSPYDFTHSLSRWPNAGNAIYNFVSRIGWAGGLAFFIYPTVVDPASTHLLTKFWSWNGWSVMARLTYGVYLVHILVYQVVISAKRRSTPFMGKDITLLFAGTLLCSYVVGAILYITVEVPASSLVRIFTSKK